MAKSHFFLLACFVAYTLAQNDNSGFLPINESTLSSNTTFSPSNSTLFPPKGTEFSSNATEYPFNITSNSSGYPKNYTSNETVSPKNSTQLNTTPSNGTEFPLNATEYPFNITTNSSGYPKNHTRNKTVSPKNSTRLNTTPPNSTYPFNNTIPFNYNNSGFSYNNSEFPYNNTGFPYNDSEIPLTNSTNETVLYAHAVLLPASGFKAKGNVSFYQPSHDQPTNISVKITGLAPNTPHGFHIHTYGDLSEGCAGTAPHWNPTNTVHGGLNSTPRHYGDLGNLVSNSEGVAIKNISDDLVFLTPPYSVIGRAIVIHKNRDDLGKGNFNDSLINGHSGDPIACGVIGIAKDFVKY